MSVAPARSREELQEERDFLLRSLRDLDAERAAGDIDEADHARLRRDYTARAAAVLRALERTAGAEVAGRGGRGEAAAGPAGRGTGGGGRRVVARPTRRRLVAGRGRSLLAGALVAALAVGAGVAVAATSGERLPGREATGSLPEGTVDRITRAQTLVSEGKILDAVKLYDEVIRDDPANPVALAERGWLVSRAGLVEEGLASIDKAIAADPAYPEAHFFRGMILWRSKHEPAGAAEEFQRVLDNRPPPDLASFVQDARRQALAEAEAEPAAGG